MLVYLICLLYSMHINVDYCIAGIIVTLIITLQVNNNGIRSFDESISQFTPQSFPLGDGRMIIAPYLADVDTIGTGIVWYRETSEASLLNRVKSDI